MSDTIDLDEAKRLRGLLPSHSGYFPWVRDDDDGEFWMVEGFDGVVNGIDEIDYALHAVNNYAALVERCEKAESEVQRLKTHDECDLWSECPCYVEGREQGDELAGARA